jgi:hypothetical protein
MLTRLTTPAKVSEAPFGNSIGIALSVNLSLIVSTEL